MERNSVHPLRGLRVVLVALAFRLLAPLLFVMARGLRFVARNCLMLCLWFRSFGAARTLHRGVRLKSRARNAPTTFLSDPCRME